MMMKNTRPTTVLKNLIVVLSCLTICDSGTWLAESGNSFIFYVNDVVDIHCNLSDPNVNVTLWVRQPKKEYRQVVPNYRIRQFDQLFKIYNLTFPDSGKYQCRAQNVTPFDVLSVHVKHDGIPKPQPKIKVKTGVEYGQDVMLECTAIGDVNLTWYKKKENGSRKDWQRLNSTRSHDTLPNWKRETKQSLTIPKFNISDNGIYVCDLYRKSVKWRASVQKRVSIGEFQKARFTEFPPMVNTFKEAEPFFYLLYELEGMPTPSISWYIVHDNGTEDLLSTCNEHKCTTKDDSFRIGRGWFYKTTELSFPKDNITYKCVASNFLGTATKAFRVNVKAKPRIESDGRKPTLIHAYESTPERDIVCLVRPGNPSEVTFTWKIQPTDCTNTDCKPNNSMWQSITDRGFNIESNNEKSTLTVPYMKDHYFFKCTAENSFGNDDHVWNVIPATGAKPLKAVQKLVEADEMENVKLQCEVSKFRFTQVYWSFNDAPVKLDSRTTVENSTRFNYTVYHTLHIKKVNITDAGKYKCSGKFNDVLDFAVIQLNIKELKAPIVSLKTVTAEQNSSFIVPCDVSGHPKPTVTWTKDGKVLELSDSVHEIRACKSKLRGIYRLYTMEQGHVTVLVICKADYTRHAGQFSCTARNQMGNDSATALVNITAHPRIHKFRSPSVKLGESFSLTCFATGNPKPRVWWEKKDVKTSTFKHVDSKQSEVLHFKAVDESNLGSYRCFAQNGFKTVKKDFQLELSPVVGKKYSVPPNNSKKYAVVIGCVSFFIVALVIIVSVVLYKRKKIYGGFYILTLPPYPDYIKKLDPHTPLTEQTNKLPYDAEWEFPRNRLKFSRELGSGAFGKVFLADAMGIVAFDPRGSTKRRSSRRRFGGSVRRNHYVNNNKMTKVAVKTLKEDSGETEYKDLLSELKILIHVGEHKNIVNLLGACTKGRESELWVITEFCSNGNLLQFLRNRRDIYEPEWKGISKDPNVQLTMTDLVITAYQIARGMEFLASRMCIHRDLATRNILLTDTYVIKIADFGLARDVGEDSQYVKTSTGLVPVKWMAIEAIIQRLFTEKSDVWSFGIVLWELFTLGGTPYPNISPNEVAEFLARGHRMDPPHACPDEISNLMVECWQDDKDTRRTFKELVEILDKIIELHTSSEGGRGYLEVQGEVMNEYLSPSEVKSPQMEPFECTSPLPPIPSPGENERDSLLLRDQNERGRKFQFDKAIRNKAARQDSEIEKIQNDSKPEIIKYPDVQCRRGNDFDGYIDTSLTGKEKERIERELEKERDSSEEPQHLGDYAYWKKSLV